MTFQLLVAALITIHPSPVDDQCATPGTSSFSALKRCARHGNKLAQIELARRFELGIGIAADPARAAKWYCRAARDINNENVVYSPPVGGSGIGHILRVPGNVTPGLAAAKIWVAQHDDSC